MIIDKDIQLNIEKTDTYNYEICADSNVIIDISNQREASISLVMKINQNVNANVLVINNANANLKLDDKYMIEGNLHLAYVQLNDYDVAVNSNYHLDNDYSELKVRSAILSNVTKTFNINTYHNKQNTIAHIDNYGIINKEGKCELVVSNKIEKGTIGCQTHQTSRILTYSNKAIGKILPILLIDENDVAASHAASIGKPNEEEIFYLQSRGLTYNEALNLISIGYLMPVSQVIKDEKINELLSQEIEKKVNETCSM